MNDPKISKPQLELTRLIFWKCSNLCCELHWGEYLKSPYNCISFGHVDYECAAHEFLVYSRILDFWFGRRPDEALLSINSFQKDLSDLNPLVRAWSLRAMSGIRVRVVVPLVVMAVTKCSRDPSAYVRRCAAHAIPKIFSVDRDSHEDVLEEVRICSTLCLWLRWYQSVRTCLVQIIWELLDNWGMASFIILFSNAEIRTRS